MIPLLYNGLPVMRGYAVVVHRHEILADGWGSDHAQVFQSFTSLVLIYLLIRQSVASFCIMTA